MATKPAGRSVVRITLSEQVYEQLKESIIDGTRTSGTRLNIDALAREIGVSSTPIRESLARLQQEGLVRLELYSGYSVMPPPEPDHLFGFFEFRTVWEGYCAEVGAPKRKPEVLAAMTAAQEKMSAVTRLGTRYREYRRFTEADAEFHQALIDGAENLAMSTTYARLHIILLQSRLHLTRMPGGAPSAEVVAEHTSILEAYRAGDGAAARAAVARHFEGGCRRLRLITLGFSTEPLARPG